MKRGTLLGTSALTPLMIPGTQGMLGTAQVSLTQEGIPRGGSYLSSIAASCSSLLCLRRVAQACAPCGVYSLLTSCWAENALEGSSGQSIIETQQGQQNG